ncbi:hypothetical protein M7I_7511 [Glarea lozoyensis 74030]|uniref:DUF7770 domain-containing protein n=1 Tax=Glarea lozoyensis (strain ATCC 74030 / MF5533) TaxID=1104152 RepID=H0EXH5_GLAL7|nr:hypothetical protein M7I_7511 [Glarea lozoyensis 74030]
MPLAYIPKSLLNTSQSQPITSIHICAEPPNAVFAPKDNADPATEKLTNHWVVYLITSPSQSIRLDPSPSGPGNTLDLIISAKDRADINAVKTLGGDCG